MLFNVSQLLRELVGATRVDLLDETLALELDEEAPPQPVRVAGPVELLRTRDGVLLRADLMAEWGETCSRCLRPFTTREEIEVAEEYLPTIDPLTGGRLPPPPEPTPFLIDEAHHLDTSEAVRQAIVLARPMQPLHDPRCRGLCPTCGVDLNETTCSCDDSPIDVRWAGLRDALTTEAAP